MFLEKYKNKLFNNGNDRYPSMELALMWFEATGGYLIVETGCVRQKDDWGAGMSTKLFGEFVKSRPEKFCNAKFISIDNNSQHIAVAKEICQGLPVEFIHEDSQEALLDIYGISLLYLDSLDCDPSPTASNLEAQEHQLKEFQAAEKRLTAKACVLLDDCGFENGGKCGMLKPYLRSTGWRCLWDGYQSLWVRI